MHWPRSGSDIYARQLSGGIGRDFFRSWPCLLSHNLMACKSAHVLILNVLPLGGLMHLEFSASGAEIIDWVDKGQW